MYKSDKRVVLTLDAGGTNFVFSAMQGFREIVQPIARQAIIADLDLCLNSIVDGFQAVRDQLETKPVAISFAFPGPADYENGVIGDLPNLPAFRGGVALAAFLEEKFRIPVYINNDGNLFAYGEALGGVLPDINRELSAANNPKRYKNLLGITLGTGFGAGVVINHSLLTGDNGCGGDVWIMRNKKYPEMIAEESVSIRAIKRVYEELGGDVDASLTPRDIFDIAQGTRRGQREAAVRSFEELGEMAADAIMHALHIVDGMVVIGGGLAGASKYILPAMMRSMQKTIHTFAGAEFPALQMKVYNLLERDNHDAFLQNSCRMISVPGSSRKINYDSQKKIGLTVSTLGTSKAVYYGAYAYALYRLDKQEGKGPTI